MGILLIIGASLITLAIFVLLLIWAFASIKAAITGQGYFIRNLTPIDRCIEATFSLVPIGIILIGIELLSHVEIK